MKFHATSIALYFQVRLRPGRLIKLTPPMMRHLDWKARDLIAFQCEGDTLVASKVSSRQQRRLERPKEQHPAARQRMFREKYGVLLAWSNTRASDEVLIRRALVAPCFDVLLDAAVEFGVDKLLEEWTVLKAEGADETVRILKHIRESYRQANAPEQPTAPPKPPT